MVVNTGLSRFGALLTLCACTQSGAPTAKDLERISIEESALTTRCPVAPDTPSWRFGWQTVHGPIGAVWTSTGEVAKVEHVYEFRAGWGIIIPSATRRDCYRVWVGNEDDSHHTLFAEVPGQPSSLDVFAMIPPDVVVATSRHRRDNVDYIDVVDAIGVRWSVARERNGCADGARLIPSPDGQSFVYTRIVRACPSGGSTHPAGTRVELRCYDAFGSEIRARTSIDFDGAEPWVSWNSAGMFVVSDQQTAVQWNEDGSLTMIPVPNCNPHAPTTSSPIDSVGRTIYWNGGIPEVSAPGREPPFGC